MDFQSLVELAPWTTIAQICNLLLQIFLFKKFLFKPIKEIIAKRQAEVDGVYDEAEKAREDAAIREKAEKDIAQEKKQAANEMKSEISVLAVDLASKVVRKEIDAADHEQLIEQFIEELGDAS